MAAADVEPIASNHTAISPRSPPGPGSDTLDGEACPIFSYLDRPLRRCPGWADLVSMVLTTKIHQ